VKKEPPAPKSEMPPDYSDQIMAQAFQRRLKDVELKANAISYKRSLGGKELRRIDRTQDAMMIDRRYAPTSMTKYSICDESVQYHNKGH